MGGKKKQFIKKGEGVKFHLVHRSQKDPLYLDESLGERVLMPADEDVDEKLIKSVNGLNLANGAQIDRTEQRFKRIEEQHKFGVYYDDDYDYLQHLRDADQEDRVNLEPEMIKVGSVLIKNEEEAEKPKLQLPSSVFASKFEEDVGYFNQAAPDHDPKIDWDPDIVKILDEDADVEYTDDLDDDFFLKANTQQEEDDDEDDEDDEDGEDGEDGEEDYDSDDLDEEESESVQDFESKSRFSNYSMTSSVIRRNQALSHLDEHFEKFFAQYDEDQIGALDTEDIDGYRINDDVIEMALQEFNKYVEKNKYQTEKVSRKSELGVVAEENSDGESLDDENNHDFDMVHFSHKKDKQDRFDCESIISTYSNLYNHPSMISERREKIALSRKTGLPLGVLGEKAKTQKELDKIDHRITRILPEVPKRHRDESKEEKRARKQAIKEHRRERRIEKKVNKLAFKEEKKTQACQIKTSMDNSNVVKIP